MNILLKDISQSLHIIHIPSSSSLTFPIEANVIKQVMPLKYTLREWICYFDIRIEKLNLKLKVPI